MYRKIQDFIDDWAYESGATLKILGNITDDSLEKNFGENVRTAGRLAWHITTSVIQMGHATGLKFRSADENSPAPGSIKAIIDAFREASDNMISEINAEWNDSTLSEVDNMFGEMWAKGKTLAVLVSHQIHHRGQLTVLMRLAGLKVPGVYGPAKEEWADYGMPAQE